MIVLLMMAGLGVDVGYLKYQKQQMQKAADAGALAAATALIDYGTTHGQPQILAAGQSDAAANGFSNGIGGVSVQVNNPPQTMGDPFFNNLNYVEVIVSQTRPTFFMRLAGRSSVYVSSRAVATAVSSGSGCLYALAPSGPNAFVVNAGTQISANCGILVGSASNRAVSVGSRTSILPTSMGVVGGCIGCTTLQDDGLLATGIAPFTDPLANVPAPTVPNCQFPALNVNTPRNVPSGVYCGGINVTTNGAVGFSGTYYLVGGGLNISGNPSLSGTGVTFYNTGNSSYAYQPIQITGAPTGSIAAPTSGPMAGILFYQDRSIGTDPRWNQVNGSGGAVYNGTFYFPTTGLQYTGAQVVDPYELLIAWRLWFLGGDTTIANHYNTLPNGASPIANAALVE